VDLGLPKPRRASSAGSVSEDGLGMRSAVAHPCATNPTAGRMLHPASLDAQLEDALRALSPGVVQEGRDRQYRLASGGHRRAAASSKVPAYLATSGSDAPRPRRPAAPTPWIVTTAHPWSWRKPRDGSCSENVTPGPWPSAESEGAVTSARPHRTPLNRAHGHEVIVFAPARP